MHFNVEWQAQRWRDLVARFPKTLAEQVRVRLRMAMEAFRVEHEKARLHGRPGLNRRTGNLIVSFKPGGTEPGLPLDRVAAWLASGSKYASIQERGGTITPTRRKYLAIPLPGALAKTGALRNKFVGTEEGTTTPSLYGVKGLILFKSKKGNLLLGEKKNTREVVGQKTVFRKVSDSDADSEGADIYRKGAWWRMKTRNVTVKRMALVPLFVLKRSVTIPPRLGFYATFRDWVAKGGFQRHVLTAMRSAWAIAKKAGRA